MTRKGFLGALLGVPFCAGWVKKLDASGKREVEVLEPVSIASQWENGDTASSTITITAMDADGTGGTYLIGGQLVPFTYTAA